MTDPSDPRGILYPERLPSFRREPAPAALADRVRWFWIPRWNLPPGAVSRQDVLPFPASNIVVEPGGVTIAGPTTRASHRELRGSGWAVGALLRPAGLTSLTSDPSAIRDAEVAFDVPELAGEVARTMSDSDDDVAREGAVRVFSRWASAHLEAPDGGGLLANAMEDAIAGDRDIVRVDDLARRLGISVRGVQRLARRYVGVAPLAIIRRYRLQESAQRLRDDPALTIARIAAELGYADHAHLTADFRRTLGMTPTAYRRSGDVTR
ncbi:helix-turn-helix domain-containing protein [Microbacterium karelineae]|uniref:helix-turn-helix domain-containing protein n=1 Tax=Microbacterium karelineae TaxID=2654283 RepID=UPI0012EAD755|nr:helix-turn-helix domain-containing protein [Microbacterium karelineae]